MRKDEFELDNRRCTVYSGDEPEFFLLQPSDEHEADFMDHEAEMISESAGSEFILASFQVGEWDRDLSPWEAPPVFGDVPFGGKAEDTLEYITEVFMPEIRSKYGLPDDLPVMIGGYSLAAFFSLWSSYQTDAFSGVAASSPSVWFPGWMDFAAGHGPKCGCIYLSLGKKEEKARNPVMAAVGDCIRKQYEILSESGVTCTLEWNDGNHFREPDVRTAKGFIWCMNSLKKRRTF